MINIEVPIEESLEDKYKRLAITNYPNIFIKLEELDALNIKKYSHLKSLESLIKVVLESKTYFTEGDILIELNNPAYYLDKNNKLLLQSVKAKVGNIFTLNIPESIINIPEFELDNFDFNYAQYTLEINTVKEQLAAFIYPEKLYLRFIYNYFTSLIKPSKINILTPVIPDNTHGFTNTIIKIMGTKISNKLEPWIMLNFSNAFINNANLLFIEKNIDSVKNKILTRQKKTQDTVWNNILDWIHRNIGKDKQLILKNKQKIINKFLIKPCEHLTKKNIKKEELTLDSDGNFYECIHGNKILCVHNFITGDKIQQLGETLYSGNTICKICGEEFIKNPEFVKISSNYSTTQDEIKKFIFKRAISVVSHIEFTAIVTPEYISKLAGNIVNAIEGSIRAFFYDLDKQKGLNSDIIIILKDIIAVVHVYAGLLLLILKNPTIITYKNTPADLNKLKKRITEDLMGILHQQLIKVKIFKQLNLENIFTTILNKLMGETIKIPRETSRYKPEDFFIYKYLKLQVNTNAKTFTEELINVLIKLAKNKNIIGNIIESNFVYLPEFLEWQKYLETFKSKHADYMLMKGILRFNEAPLMHNPQLIYNTDYAGFIYGLEPNFHKHIWSLACINKSQVNIKQVELEQELDYIICAICKQKKQTNNNIVIELNKLTVKNSKITFYKEYCPVKFTHNFKNNVCEYCKYGTEDFFNKYDLPTKYITLQKPIETENENTVNNLDIKLSNNPPKLLNIPKVTKDMYSNFWKTLGQYEDVTFKNLLAGKEGNKNTACYKIISFLNTLNIILGQIKFLSDNPNKTLEQFHSEFNAKLLSETINNIYTLINNTRNVYTNNSPEYYNVLQGAFIDIFNTLPPKFSEFWFKKILELTKINALSEDNVKAKSLITYKTKIIDESIEQSTEKNNFNFEGFDYDGINHKE